MSSSAQVSGNFRPQQGGATAFGTPQQTGVLYLGAALAIVGNWTAISGAYMHAFGSPNAPVPKHGGNFFGLLAGEVVLILILWLLAGISQSAGTFALLLVIGLWVAWAINHAGLFSFLATGSQGK